MSNITETKLADAPESPDDSLSVSELIYKYQQAFARHFLPKYCYSVRQVEYWWGEEVTIVARVRPIWQPIHGKTAQFKISIDKIESWRKNVKLYDFVNR